jgi:hypothetical protein
MLYNSGPADEPIRQMASQLSRSWEKFAAEVLGRANAPVVAVVAGDAAMAQLDAQAAAETAEAADEAAAATAAASSGASAAGAASVMLAENAVADSPRAHARARSAQKRHPLFCARRSPSSTSCR